MANKLRKFMVFIVILQLLGQFIEVESRQNDKKGKGKGKAFGAGILAGGLAGAAIGHILTRKNNPTEIHHYNHEVDPNAAASMTKPVAIPPPRPITSIEKGETFPNGCYKQIIKEPDIYDVRRFIETEQLICPQNLPGTVPPTYVHQMPVVPVQQPQPIVPAVPIAPVPIHVQPGAPTVVNSHSQTVVADLAHLKPNLQHPEQYMVPALPIVVNPAQTQPAIVHPPVEPTAPAPFGTPQVIELSKKTGFYEDVEKKKNAANSLLANNFVFLLFSGLVLLMI